MAISILDQRRESGRALRKTVARGRHSEIPPFDRDPLVLVEAANVGRLPALVPIRYGRMLQSPFTFYRGAAALMAHDLAGLPRSGLHVQLCGDCHLMNFGIYGTPERNLVFDINDFDETLPGPWEWDVKRLATSFVIAARHKGFSAQAQEDAAQSAVQSYREKLWEFAAMTPLEVWYAHIDADDVALVSPSPRGAQSCQQMIASARKHNAASLIPRMIESVGGALRLKDEPPLLYHLKAPEELTIDVPHLLEAYKHNLQDNRSVLLSRYCFADAAIKVVGVGSVGTRCLAVLMLSAQQQPLVLQLKEARESVLAPYVGKSHYAFQGRRVVEGQRLMQAATDVFLGWARTETFGLDFYVRQLRDWKGTLDMEALRSPIELEAYARLCGWALARAHSRAGGQAAEMSGYLGQGDSFDRAVVKFSVAFANQNQKDYEALQSAAKSGRIQTASG